MSDPAYPAAWVDSMPANDQIPALREAHFQDAIACLCTRLKKRLVEENADEVDVDGKINETLDVQELSYDSGKWIRVTPLQWEYVKAFLKSRGFDVCVEADARVGVRIGVRREQQP